MTETQTPTKFSSEMWAAFWAAPDESRIGDILACLLYTSDAADE